MVSTIENINSNIIKKIQALSEILNIFSGYQLSYADELLKEKTLKSLQNLQQTYDFGSIDILRAYFENKSKETYQKFIEFLVKENILNKLKHIYTFCTKIINNYVLEEDFSKLLNMYTLSPIIIHNNNRQCNDTCICGNPYKIEASNSEFICEACGHTEKLYGVIFEDEQFYYQEGNRTKHGRYDPTKHCRFWVERIQAKENTDIPTKVINKIKACIRRDNVWLDQLTCPIIRQYLKECKLTTYNDHVPLILKQITGKEPMLLTENESKRLYVYFSRVIEIYNRVKPTDKPNCPYHPFFIYKILEHLLKHDKVRRDDILSRIHLQSRDTLVENDKIWKRICNDPSSDFTYKPTLPD